VTILGPVAAGRGLKGWLLPHGFFMGIYILYGLGNCFVGGIVSLWDLEMLWLLLYLAAAGLGLTFSALWAPKFQRKFRDGQSREASWQEEDHGTAIACFWGVSGVFAAALVPQLALLAVAQHLGGAILWPLSFAFLTSAVAGLGAYFYVGYAGMADLHALDEFLRGRRGGEASDLPRGLIEGLSAEMSMLRTVVGSLVVLYPSTAIGSLFALDKLPRLFGKPADWDVPAEATAWFIVGVALLLFGAHATVAGPAHGRYYDIARWLQWRQGPR